MKNDIIEFEIPHYEKYHPKKGYKKNPWVRIDVDIWDDPKCSQLAAWEMSCWIYLITCCGRNNTGMSSCSLRNGASRVRVKPHLMLRAIEHLEQLQLLKVLNRTQMGANERNERTNVTNVTNERDRGQRAFALKSAPPPKEKNSHWLAELWNSHRGKLPFCRIPVSPQRLKLIKARVKSEPDPKVWADVIQRLAESRFCNGENDRGWVADFKFLLKPDTLEATLEGRYDNRARILRTREDAVSEGNAALFMKYENEGDDNETEANNFGLS